MLVVDMLYLCGTFCIYVHWTRVNKSETPKRKQKTENKIKITEKEVFNWVQKKRQHREIASFHLYKMVQILPLVISATNMQIVSYELIYLRERSHLGGLPNKVEDYYYVSLPVAQQI